MALRGRQLLRDWLTRSNHNQRDLARKLGVSEPYLSQILSGNRRPKLELLIAIEAASGVPVGSWAEPLRGKSDPMQKRTA